MDIITVNNLVKSFQLSKKQKRIEKIAVDKKIAVNNLSFSIHKGEMYGLLGTNGAGKTTTLRMISTLIKPDSGTIIVDGFDVNNEPAKVRTKIGFLTSELKLEAFFTPNYLFDYFSKLHGVEKKESEQRRKSMFSRLGIDSFAEVKIGDLSTGMKQKASIAISLVHDPDIVIFDEPTNGLDIITAKVVTDFLLSLKEEGKTIVVSSHIFSLIEKTCDRVGIIVDGRMAFEDEVKKILCTSSLEDRFFSVYEKSKGGIISEK